MDSKDSDKGLFGFLSPVRAPLGRRKRPQLSCNRNRSCRYDVFISFRGTDTSKTFVDHLYAHLIRKGIFAFKDDIELRKGELISPQLVQAIQDSRVSIVVFSEDYASSSRCLDEMAAIADCHQKFKQTVFLVFYHMDPSHVRKQSGVYENAFVSHNKKFKQDPGKVDRWKTSMTNLGNLNGWHVKDDKPEFGEIEKIVQEVIKALGHKFSGIADDLIGIQPRVEELEKLLKLSSTNDDFRVLGIWGMRGIGKTTHATVLYDKISYGFDACCFIENVSRIYRDGGAIAVRKQILHQTLGGINLEDCRSFEMSGIVRHGLRNLKVLIVLDNVDQFEQLRSLEIYPKLLHTGSRMIITTRDEHILRAYKADEIHEVSLMIKNDDHELFCKRAFESEEQSSKDNGLCGCLSPVWALLDCRKVKRPQLSSNPSPLGQGSPTCSSMDSNLNQSSGPALDLSPLGQGGPSSSSMDSNIIMQSTPPSSDVSLLGQGGPTSTPMDSNINQTIGPSSYLSLLGQEGTASSSSNSIQSCRYDVFISFRGIDTRNTFVDHLYDHLIRKGIFAFKDDERLQKGELISPQLVQAIKDSRISVVVFSRDYASSSWCLDEMATVVECHQQLNQTVIPVFYDVDPSHVRKQNGVYENAFVLHDEKFQQDPSKVVGWKSAMKNLGNLVGFDVRNRPESTMIQKIVQGVIKKLNLKFSWFTEDLIGIQPRVEELEKLLKLSSANDDFRVLGIWGMGGIGKTTHATVLYDKISYGFDACCFIENVSRIYRDGGAIAVQKQILHQTLGEINLEAYRSFEISGIVRHRLRNLKVLIVLDNVDQLEQLQQLEIDPKLLHTGGRMIITTRDEHILRVYKADEIHKVSLMNENDAHELFCKKAFESEEQSSKCMELISEVLKYAQCLPLAIKVLGSSLCTRDATQWEDVLDRLEKSPNKEIMDVLEISVEGLQYEDREIFLHIACFFKGEREEYVRRILDACALNPRIGIQNLVEKSLITIKNEEIHMHEMLQKLGEKIVRHKYPNEPESWSRVWHYEDFHHLLMTETGTIKVKAIVLNKKEEFLECEAQQLSKLVHLKLLILYHKDFVGELEFLSMNLRFLLWHECPLLTLPLKFEPYFLVELNMPYSNIQQVWKGCKRFPCLKRMDLSNSKYLTETPNFEGVTALERLDLTGCTSLCHVHPSIGSLSKLAFLSLQNCSNLVQIDFGSVSNLSSLRVLHLSGCTKLESTPNFTGASSNLEYLDMDGCTSLSLVHESTGALAKLRFLSMRDCTNLDSIPINTNTMTSLITLDFYGCSKLGNLSLISAVSSSSNMKSLISLDLSFCHLHEIPDAIRELSCLERLNLQGNNFASLPSAIFDLFCLAYLNLSHCHELETLPFLPIESAESASLVGRYFTMTSGSRDHRSGLYLFDCPKVVDYTIRFQFMWLTRLLKEPRHFRCGFDIVSPYDRRKDTYFKGNPFIETWFDHIFRGDSIRVVHCDVDENWIGFLFSVEFEAEYPSTISSSPHHSSSPPLPHPFYLSFETECTEQRFDMPLNLELDKIDGSRHIWTIYISRQHCHFIETGAHITFKACPGLVVKNWGLRRIVKQDIDVLERIIRGIIFAPSCNKDIEVIKRIVERISTPLSCNTEGRVIENVEKISSSSYGPKIQLPYNWLVTEEDEVENFEAKAKENNLSNLGL